MLPPELHLELSKLASLAYQKHIDANSTPAKWRLIKESPSSIDGYKGYAFSNGKLNVLVHRGTDELADSLSNLQLSLKETPLQLIAATMFTVTMDKYFGKIDIHVGHSLGGAIAQLIAINTESDAVAFDSPGIGELANKISPKSIVNSDRVTEYLSAPNFINTLDTHLGDLYKVSIPNKQKHANLDSYIKYSVHQHSIVNIVNAMKGNITSVIQWPKGFAEGYNEFTDSFQHKSFFDFAAVIVQKIIAETANQKIDKFVDELKANENYSNIATPVTEKLTNLFKVILSTNEVDTNYASADYSCYESAENFCEYL